MDPRGAVFLVTGAASGLGAACVRALRDAGAVPVGVDVRDVSGASGLYLRADATSEPEMRNALASARDQCGRIDGLIACAGIAVSQRAVAKDGATPLDSFERALRINVLGTFNAARLVGEAIARQGRPNSGESAGVIVMTSSVAAFDGQIGQSAYAASKGAVAALTLPLAREFASFNVRVASIAPGLFDTPMLAGLPEEARARLAEQPAFPKRLGRPEEFAALALHIIENEMINGETIRLDGAIRLPAR
jgi:NAD(P)-dependent dehydrogenase (short-subunit alcohol dehydrogenase family)